MMEAIGILDLSGRFCPFLSIKLLLHRKKTILRNGWKNKTFIEQGVLRADYSTLLVSIQESNLTVTNFLDNKRCF